MECNGEGNLCFKRSGDLGNRKYCSCISERKSNLFSFIDLVQLQKKLGNILRQVHCFCQIECNVVLSFSLEHVQSCNNQIVRFIKLGEIKKFQCFSRIISISHLVHFLSLKDLLENFVVPQMS